MSMCSIARISFHGDGDFLRVQWRIEGLVQVVRKHQFKRVLAWRQGQRRLGLALAEVQYLVGRRQRGIELQFAEVSIDDEMMVPRILEFASRRRDSHTLQSKAHGDRSVDRRAVLRSDDI